MLDLAIVDTLLIADWAQTRTISANPDKYRETNKVLSSHPSAGRVNTHFLLYIAAVHGVYFAIPEKYRLAYTVGIGLAEGYYVSKNLRLGIGFNF